MPSRKTHFTSHSYYHFYNRGNNRGAIFFEKANYLFFLRKLRQHLLPHLESIAYCLMPTHYHLLGRIKPASKTQTSEVLKTSEVFDDDSARISRAMKNFSISYTKAINKRFDRVGSLFQGAFQAKLIQSDTHLLHLCRYIHGNPVKDGLVTNPADWPYSNYLEWIGQRGGTLFDASFVQAHFPTPEKYRAFVMEDLHARQLPPEIKTYLDLG